MAEPGNAPSSQRRFHLTAYALERYRLLPGNAALSGDEVGELLESRLSAALDAGKVEELMDRNRASLLVVLEESADEDAALYALLRPGERQGPEWSIITIANGTMRRRSFASKAWVSTPARRPHAVEPAPEPTRQEPPRPAPELRPADVAGDTWVSEALGLEMEPAAAPGTEPSSWLVTWRARDGAPEELERLLAREEVRRRVATLHLSGARDIRLHAEVALSVRAQVDVEF